MNTMTPPCSACGARATLLRVVDGKYFCRKCTPRRPTPPPPPPARKKAA